MEETTILRGTGPKTSRLPHFWWKKGRLAPCSNVGTRAETSEGVTLDAHQFGTGGVEAIFYLPEHGQGRRRPKGWSADVKAKLADLCSGRDHA